MNLAYITRLILQIVGKCLNLSGKDEGEIVIQQAQVGSGIMITVGFSTLMYTVQISLRHRLDFGRRVESEVKQK